MTRRPGISMALRVAACTSTDAGKPPGVRDAFDRTALGSSAGVSRTACVVPTRSMGTSEGLAPSSAAARPVSAVTSVSCSLHTLYRFRGP